MNWLDPSDVEAWLADQLASVRNRHISQERVMDIYNEALEHFVRAMAADETGHDLTCSLPYGGTCDCAYAVARLLVKEMGHEA